MYFNKESLISFCKDNNIILAGEYDKVNRRTKLRLKCKDCHNDSDRTFEQIYKFGSICKDCVMKNKGKKISEKLSASASIQDKDKNVYIINCYYYMNIRKNMLLLFAY